MTMSVKSLPDWFPGAGFKQVGREWAATLTELTEKPYALVKQQMAENRNQLSVLSALLEEENRSDPEEVFVNKWTAMSLYTAGADTVRRETDETDKTPFFSCSSYTDLDPDGFFHVLLLPRNDGFPRGAAQGSSGDRPRHRNRIGCPHLQTVRICPTSTPWSRRPSVGIPLHPCACPI